MEIGEAKKVRVCRYILLMAAIPGFSRLSSSSNVIVVEYDG